MSQEKKAQLVAAGKLRPDGTRIETCPVCGQELPEHLTAAALAAGEHAVGVPDAVAVSAKAPTPKGG